MQPPPHPPYSLRSLIDNSSLTCRLAFVIYKDCNSPHHCMGFLFFALCPPLRPPPTPPPHHNHSSYKTHHINSSYTTLVTSRSSYTTPRTQLISHNSSHPTHHIHLSYTTHLTQLVTSISSYTTHHILLILRNSSHTTHLTQLTTPHSSHPTHLTRLITPHPCHTTHHVQSSYTTITSHSSYTTLHTPLILLNSSHPRFRGRHRAWCLECRFCGRRSTQSLPDQLRHAWSPLARGCLSRRFRGRRGTDFVAGGAQSLRLPVV